MTQSHKSTKMSIKNVSPSLPEGMILFPLNGSVRDTTDSVFATYNTTTFREDEAKFMGSVAVESATTNLIKNGNFLSGTDSWSFSKSAGSTASSSVSAGWYSINVPEGETGFFYYVAQDVTAFVPANQTVTFSVTFKNTTAATFALRLVTYANSVNRLQILAPVTLDGSGGTRTFIVQATDTVDSTSFRFDILAGSYYGQYGGLSDKSVEFTSCMAEARDHSTSFVDGSRPVGVLRFDISSLRIKDSGCVSVWVYQSDSLYNDKITHDSIKTNKYLVKLGSSSTNHYANAISIQAPSLELANRKFSIFNYLSSSSTGQTVPCTKFIRDYPQGSWNHFVIQWDKNGLLSGNKIELYINGVLEAGSLISDYLPSDDLLFIHLGNWAQGSGHVTDTLFEQLAIHPFQTFSPEVIESWYTSNAPFIDTRDAFFYY